MVPGASIPLFEVTDAKGVAHGTQRHWQRQAMLVALLHSDPGDPCGEVFRQLRERAPRLWLEEIAVIGIAVEGDVPGAIADPDGSLAKRFQTALGLDHAAGTLVVSTKFGQVVRTLDAHDGTPGHVIAEALEWMRYGQTACEDCSVPLWD